MNRDGDVRRWSSGDVGVLALGAALATIAATITARGSNAGHPALEATARALMVGVPLTVGVYARARPASRRFGDLLIVAGSGWALTALTEASDPLLHTIGRMAGWCVEPLLVLLVLSFPSGRLPNKIDRLLVGSVAAIVVVLYLPSVLLIERFPEPSPWGTCSAGCPANPLSVVSSEPAVFEDLVRPMRELLVSAIFAVVSVRLAFRLPRATALTRRTVGPVLVVATLRFASFAVLIVARRIDSGSEVVLAAMWSLSLGVPLLALAFLIGLIHRRLFIARASEQLAAHLAGHPHLDDLQSVIARTFDDSTIRILYPSRDGTEWTDERGESVQLPAIGNGRHVTEVRENERVVAAIAHEASLTDERGFIDAAKSYVLLPLDNRRLGVEAARLLAEVQESRSRIQATADEERRRVERDLHDGAQQRLVALRIKLELAAEGIEEPEPLLAETLRRLGGDVDSALDEVRSLARGIYPSPLADRGLVEALRSAAIQAPLATTLLATAATRRYAQEVESAAYFCCLEAMQNAAKHASGVTVVVVEVSDNGVLRFEVRDDGAGFSPNTVQGGVGFISMRDRIAAVGGTLAVVSSPGHGTRVVGRIPLKGRTPGRVAGRAASSP